MLKALAMLALFQLYVFGKKHCILKGIFITVLGGLCALWLLSLASPILGFSLTMKPGTALFCGVLGIPGTILLCLLSLL